MQVMVPDYLMRDLLPKMRAIDPEVALIPIGGDGSYTGSLKDAEVLFKFHIGDPNPMGYGDEALRTILREAPHLRWMHYGKAGVEDILIPELVDSPITLTNGAGGPKRAIAETVLAFILADAKSLYTHFINQKERVWKNLPHRELPGFTVAILGLGKIGLEIARLCKALDMRVIGTKRSLPESQLPNVDQLFLSSQQEECVRQADYVVVASALTPETRGMVNRATFQAMRPDALFINIARGAIVDEDALLEALRDERIRGAYLDVFVKEPLPPDSPFFSLDNVVVMPHNSPFSQNVRKHMLDIFLENFRRYCSGEPLLNVVDKRAGY